MDKTLYEKYHLPPIEEYPFGERDWYETFLAQTDKVVLKAAESLLTGNWRATTEFLELVKARQEARTEINKGGET